MKCTFNYQITSDLQNISIEKYLREKGYSHHILTLLKRLEDGICVNHSHRYTNTLLRKGDLLTVTLPPETSSEHIVPTALPLDIVYEDDHILVINKNADTPIHPSHQNYDNTLANGVAYYYQTKGESFVYRCINRLDRDTTGLLIIAKHILSASILGKMMRDREIRRQYLAIVKGILPDSGTICAPITRKEGSVIERCVDFEHGEKAVTHYRRLLTKDGYSLASLRLETGRTHQIRIHMKHLGYPLIGDYLYNPDFARMNRLSLHSCRLDFTHPITQKPMAFEVPLPGDMRWIYG